MKRKLTKLISIFIIAATIGQDAALAQPSLLRQAAYGERGMIIAEEELGAAKIETARRVLRIRKDALGKERARGVWLLAAFRNFIKKSNFKRAKVFEIGGSGYPEVRNYLQRFLRSSEIFNIDRRPDSHHPSPATIHMDYEAFLPQFAQAPARKKPRLIFSADGVSSIYSGEAGKRNWQPIADALAAGGYAVIRPTNQDIVFAREAAAIFEFAQFLKQNGVIVEHVYVIPYQDVRDRRIFVLRKDRHLDRKKRILEAIDRLRKQRKPLENKGIAREAGISEATFYLYCEDPDIQSSIQNALREIYHPDNMLEAFRNGRIYWAQIPEEYFIGDTAVLVRELAALRGDKPLSDLNLTDFEAEVFETGQGKRKKSLHSLPIFIKDKYGLDSYWEAVLKILELIGETSEPYHPRNVLETFKRGRLLWEKIPEKYLLDDIRIFVDEFINLSQGEGVHRDINTLTARDFLRRRLFVMNSGRKKSLHGLLRFIKRRYGLSGASEAVLKIRDIVKRGVPQKAPAAVEQCVLRPRAAEERDKSSLVRSYSSRPRDDSPVGESRA